jgi:hypothetical protein
LNLRSENQAAGRYRIVRVSRLVSAPAAGSPTARWSLLIRD